jgi:hypothetical protein
MNDRFDDVFQLGVESDLLFAPAAPATPSST